jgi:predicted dinucleotide-binding enzyme
MPMLQNRAKFVLVSTPWDAAQEALQSAGDLSGKILIDATNPLLPGLEGLSFGCNISAGSHDPAFQRSCRKHVMTCCVTISVSDS